MGGTDKPKVSLQEPAQHHGVLDVFKKAGEVVFDGIAAIPGVVELAGMRYPVKTYSYKCSEQVTRGSRLDDAHIAELGKQGFKAIIDLTAEGTGDTDAALKAGMLAVNVPMMDNSLEFLTNPKKIEGQMVDMLCTVGAKEYQPVYMHCEAGVGRTGVAVACYRMSIPSTPPGGGAPRVWTPDEAVAEAEKFGLHLPDQLNFIRTFGNDLAAGKFAAEGFPMTETSR